MSSTYEYSEQPLRGTQNLFKRGSAAIADRCPQWIRELAADLNLALRRLLRAPGYSGGIVGLLAVSMTALTLTLTFVDSALFGSLNVARADRLFEVSVRSSLETPIAVSLPMYRALLSGQTPFEQLAAAQVQRQFTLLGEDEPRVLEGAATTANFFDAFGVKVRLGRFFSPTEQVGANVIVLGERFWHRHYQDQPGVLGRSLNISGRLYTVIGVAPRLPGSWDADVYVTDPFESPGISPEVIERGFAFLSVIGSVREGPDPGARVASALQLVLANYAKSNPGNVDASWKFAVTSLRDDVYGDAYLPLCLLFLAVGALVVLSWANVANLTLVRCVSREPEIALLRTLGSPLWRIARLFWLESALLAVFAGALAIFAARVLLPVLLSSLVPLFDFTQGVALSFRAIMFVLGMSLLASLLFGLLPALRIRHLEKNLRISTTGKGITRGSLLFRVRTLFIALQVAASMLLVAGAAQLLVELTRLGSLDAKFETRQLFTAVLAIPESRYPDGASKALFFDKLVRAVRTLPEVDDASVTCAMPLADQCGGPPYAVVEAPIPMQNRPIGMTNSIQPGYFSTLRIPLLAGRDFTLQDTASSPPVTILSAATARALYADADPIGHFIYMGLQDGTGKKVEVVGVAADVRMDGKEPIEPTRFYRPFAQRDEPLARVVVRLKSDPAAFGQRMRTALHGVDAEVPIQSIQTGQDIVDGATRNQRFLCALISMLASLALLSACAGLHSVMSYTTSQRMEEFGVRIALGARIADLARLLGREALPAVGIGALIGIASFLTVFRLLSHFVALSTTNLASILPAAFAVLAAISTACWVPIRRAASASVFATLRSR